MPLNTVNSYQKTMAANKNDQSVTKSLDGRSHHDSRVKNPITADDQYLPYPKDDRVPFDYSEAVLVGRKENINLYDYPANDRAYLLKDWKVRILKSIILNLLTNFSDIY